MKKIILLFLLLSIGLLALGGWAIVRKRNVSGDSPVPDAETPPWFIDVTDELGIQFLHDAGPVGSYFMPQQMGSGVALFDFDGDGLLDLYFLQNGGPDGAKNVLYKQRPDGKFVDVSKGSGLEIAGYNMGVAIGDVNNDGWPDVLVTQHIGVKLFLNNGNGTFTDVTQEAGLSNPAWGTSAAFVDYDRDGWLDLVVVNYVNYDPSWPCTGRPGGRDFCSPKDFEGRVTRLFHNQGGMAGTAASPDGKKLRARFLDVTEASGLGRLPGPGLGVLCADFDGDGWPDIFVANDGVANRLWINQKNGTFREEAVQRGIAYNAMGREYAGMGVALGDVYCNGLFDIFVTHLGEETHTLWKQGPRGLFLDKTAETGLIAPNSRGTGFGTVLADFDNDGILDLAIVNGRVGARTPVEDWSLGPFWSAYGERNQLFRGEVGGRFRDISSTNKPLCAAQTVSRGLARGDLHGDGGQDLVVTSVASRARIYRNVAPQRGHWLSVRAIDPAFKRDAYGAEIRLRLAEQTRTAWVTPAESYLCSSDPRAHFGLGGATQFERLEVLWPDGILERFPGGSADRAIVLTKGSGQTLKK